MCRTRPWLLAAGLLSALAGCDYSSPTPMVPTGMDESDVSKSGATVSGTLGSSSFATSSIGGDGDEKRGAILDHVINLIQTASLKPGGQNFEIATDNLNQYFEHTPASDFAMSSAARAYLSEELPPQAVPDLESPRWSLRDARHIEDCMLYHSIATRVAGSAGDDLTRVRRLFDWTVRQIMLVPPGSLGLTQAGEPAYARPYDVLVRGMATEAEGFWAERGWLFLSLCRQIGIDAGLITYTPAPANQPVGWVCGVLIDKQIYLFDARIGLEVPGPTGEGVATLTEAMSQPVVLDRLDLPGQSPYGTTAALLTSSPSKIGIWIDSSPGYLSPRMLLLQRSLVGKDRTILYRDPAEQRDRFVEALGPHAGKVTLWTLPLLVQTKLFHDAQFVELTKRSLFLFQSQFPLIYARIKQLRGETKEAIREYVDLRLLENATLMDKKTPMPRDVQEALDVHATYYLALAFLERDDPKQAARFFEMTLGLLPEYGPGRPYYNMLRWGAQSNLGRLAEAEGHVSRAVAYYTERKPTYQAHGDHARARALIWQDPTGAEPAALPPAPPADAGR
jgi:hypothetical protein